MPDDSPRILIVTPEVTYLPEGISSDSDGYSAKAGGLADVSAALISALYDLSCDVHVAIPDYRSIYHGNNEPRSHREVEKIRRRLHEERIHFAVDRVFLYKDGVYSGYSDKDLRYPWRFSGR